ncbi:MAG: DUF2029 domain-containing protein [Gemmataceae bacterium]|nr:DUF2029 domain-containing protein [Gemmataceae bacterium]
MDAPINQMMDRNLKTWEKWGLGFLLVFFLFFADVVLIRSAFLSRVMGDADVFFRAGWAVRAGKNIYEVTDPNGWHYNYPPLFAISMAPLGDPPTGESRVGFLPYPVSVGILYKISFLSLILALFALSRALEVTQHEAFKDLTKRKWYYLRVLALVACLAPIAHTLMRGQVNLFLLCLVCLGLSCQILGQRISSGFFIALAICLKIIPAFLLIVPMWRKDARQLSGCLVGLVIGLGLIPASVLGVEKTKDAYFDLYRVLIAPALGISNDSSRGVELNDFNSTDNHSILAFLHGVENPDLSKKPPKPAKVIKIIYLLMSLVLLGWLLWTKGQPGAGTALEDAYFYSLALLLMVMVCPTSHSSYFLLAVPLIMTTLVFHWQQNPGSLISGGLLLGILAYGLANAIPLLPQMEVLKRMGFCLIPNFVLFVYGMICLGKMRALAADQNQPLLSKAA